MREANCANPGSFHFFPFDLARIGEISSLVKTMRKSVGPIYGLVNNAAVSFEGVLSLMPTAQIEQLVRLNTPLPHRPHEVCGALHDGQWRRTGCEHRLDCRRQGEHDAGGKRLLGSPEGSLQRLNRQVPVESSKTQSKK